MRSLLGSIALCGGILAGLIVAGLGIFFAVFEETGIRGVGLLLALAGSFAVAAQISLVRAPSHIFAGRAGFAFLAGTTILATLPPAAIALAALMLAVNPLGSAFPAFEWLLSAIGAAFALTAVALAATGWSRANAGGSKTLPTSARLQQVVAIDRDLDAKQPI